MAFHQTTEEEEEEYANVAWIEIYAFIASTYFMAQRTAKIRQVL
jgi:hypothetical protein